MKSSPILRAALLLGAAPLALAADLTVDATGGAAYTTVGQAMAVASPGDRILVMPGSYPAFQFSKGVHVHGMGALPGDVVIARVDYHVGDPTIAYDSTLSNLSVAAGAGAGYLALTGNELPPGVLVLDGVILSGGVFLGGGGDGFALQMTNSRVAPGVGQGFLDAAMHVGGPGSQVEIVDSRIDGWDAAPGRRAGTGLRLVGGTRARLSDVRVTGGDGLASDAISEPGASAVTSGFWPEPVRLTVDGDSTLTGGEGAGLGAGGHAVDVDGEVSLGLAVVQGGAGFPDGEAWADAWPQPLPFDLHLELTPTLRDADGVALLQTGALVELELSAPGPAAIGLSFALDLPPANGPFFVLAPQTLLFVIGDSLPLNVPPSPFVGDVPALMLYAQGLARDPLSGQLHIGNSVALRVDLLGAPR